MDDCGSEKTICYEEDGWSVTLTRYVSMELGETVASWVEFPNGWYLHSDDADAEFTQDGARAYRCTSGYIRNGMAHEYPVRGFHFKRE